MAIKDWDGSAWREIGKVYDNNGSANTQIGKVYDNNGTTNSLIYSADDPILVPNAELKSSWAFYTNRYDDGDGVGMECYWSGNNIVTKYGSNGGSAQARIYVDFTPYKSLTFTVSGWLYYARIYCGVKDAWASKWSDNTWLVRGEYLATDERITNKTITVNVSSINRYSYVLLYAYGGFGGVSGTHPMEWSSIKLS